jgi:hypothetical protein
VEGRARRRQREIRAIDGDRDRAGARDLVGEQAVVGSEKAPGVVFEQDDAARRADSRIDHCQVEGRRRKGRGGGRQDEGRFLDIARRDVVREVDDRRSGSEAEHRPLDRRDVVVARAEVGEQREQWRRRRHRGRRA